MSSNKLQIELSKTPIHHSAEVSNAIAGAVRRAIKAQSNTNKQYLHGEHSDNWSDWGGDFTDHAQYSQPSA
jgi:hypothetical protein